MLAADALSAAAAREERDGDDPVHGVPPGAGPADANHRGRVQRDAGGALQPPDAAAAGGAVGAERGAVRGGGVGDGGGRRPAGGGGGLRRDGDGGGPDRDR